MVAKHAVLAAFILVGVAGCSRHGGQTPKTAPVAVAAHVATPDEWRAALTASYKETSRKEGSDGTTEFMANFDPSGKTYNMLTFGERDGFRKLRIFKAGLPMHILTGVKAYISVPDNEAPVLFLQPYFWGRNGWLFMNKVSVMVDGEVILEHTCGKVDRDTEGVGVAELCNVLLSSDEIAALRKVVNSAKVAVRLTGDKGYVNVESKGKSSSLDEFKRDIQSAIAVYDVIYAATKDHIPPKPPKSA